MEFLTHTQQGERLKALREKAGKSLEDAALVVGADVSDVERFESGEEKASAHEIAALSDLYCQPVSAFLITDGDGPVMFRQGDATSEGVARSLRTMESCMVQFFAAESLEQATR